MRFYLVLAVLLGASYTPSREVTHAKWNGTRFSCPADTDMWASESEAIAGRKDFVYCIPSR